MGSISIVGLGHEPETPLSSGTIERLRAADRVVTAVGESGVSEALDDLGIEPFALEFVLDLAILVLAAAQALEIGGRRVDVVLFHQNPTLDPDVFDHVVHSIETSQIG